MSFTVLFSNDSICRDGRVSKSDQFRRRASGRTGFEGERHTLRIKPAQERPGGCGLSLPGGGPRRLRHSTRNPSHGRTGAERDAARLSATASTEGPAILIRGCVTLINVDRLSRPRVLVSINQEGRFGTRLSDELPSRMNRDCGRRAGDRRGCCSLP